MSYANLTEKIASKTLERLSNSKKSGLEPNIVRGNLFVINKQIKLVPFVPNRVQVDYRTRKTRRNLIVKSRQQGISTEVQAENFVEAVCHTSFQATLAHDAETTAKLRRITTRFYDNLPDSIRPVRALDNATTTVYANTKSEVTIATAGSHNVGRGGTYNRVHGSEVAFWPDAEAIMAGLLQGVPQEGIIDLESTPNGAKGYFYQKCMESLDGSNEWNLFFYPWWYEEGYRLPLEPGEKYHFEDDELELILKYKLSPEQIKWRRSKQRELKHIFPQEYPEDVKGCFLRSGLGYFGDLNCYNAPMNPIYNPDLRYFAGLDFAQTYDYTVLSVFDRLNKCQVDLLRINKLPWNEMRRRILDKCQQWNIAIVYAESNSLGKTNIEALRSEKSNRGLLTRIVPFETSNTSKALIMAQMHEALHIEGWQLLPITEQKREMAAFSSKQTVTGLWQLSSPSNEHDDIVIANALGLHACLRPATIAFEV